MEGLCLIPTIWDTMFTVYELCMWMCVCVSCWVSGLVQPQAVCAHPVPSSPVQAAKALIPRSAASCHMAATIGTRTGQDLLHHCCFKSLSSPPSLLHILSSSSSPPSFLLSSPLLSICPICFFLSCPIYLPCLFLNYTHNHTCHKHTHTRIHTPVPPCLGLWGIILALCGLICSLPATELPPLSLVPGHTDTPLHTLLQTLTSTYIYMPNWTR